MLLAEAEKKMSCHICKVELSSRFIARFIGPTFDNFQSPKNLWILIWCNQFIAALDWNIWQDNQSMLCTNFLCRLKQSLLLVLKLHSLHGLNTTSWWISLSCLVNRALDLNSLLHLEQTKLSLAWTMLTCDCNNNFFWYRRPQVSQAKGRVTSWYCSWAVNDDSTIKLDAQCWHL